AARPDPRAELRGAAHLRGGRAPRCARGGAAAGGRRRGLREARASQPAKDGAGGDLRGGGTPAGRGRRDPGGGAGEGRGRRLRALPGRDPHGAAASGAADRLHRAARATGRQPRLGPAPDAAPDADPLTVRHADGHPAARSVPVAVGLSFTIGLSVTAGRPSVALTLALPPPLPLTLP